MQQKSTYTIELRGVSLGYPGRLLYEGINLTLAQGELIALIGRNGTGKSTLLRAMSGLHHLLKGEIKLNGHNLKKLSVREIANHVSFVSTEEIRVGNLRAYDVVGLGRASYTNWIGRLTNDDRQRVEEALALVGMSGFASKSIDSLSDGERQRVMIARALAQDTPIILLDEPTAFLDLPNKYEIMFLLHRLAHEKQKTIIVSTHDLNIALEQCDRIVMIDHGRFFTGTPVQMLATGEIQQLFADTVLYYDTEKQSIRIRNFKNDE